MSEDGTNLAAMVAKNGGIYASNDSGISFHQIMYPNSHLKSFTFFNNGSSLVTSYRSSGRIFISHNKGASWEDIEFADIKHRTWTSFASSSNGSLLVAASVSADGGIYISKTGGVTWIKTSAPHDLRWQSVKSSYNGSVLAAMTYSSVFVSTNGGETWDESNPTGMKFYSQNWALALSGDGSKLVAMDSAFRVVTSTDSGTTWAKAADLSDGRYGGFTSIASSEDGSILVAGAYNGDDSIGRPLRGYVFISTNIGVSWDLKKVFIGKQVFSVACSKDGSRLAAAVDMGGIYMSFDSGQSWALGWEWESAFAMMNSTHIP